MSAESRQAELLSGLNPEQRRAVETTEGPLLVLAGAGSGKTRVLVHRLAYLVGVCGIPAENLLAVTFTNKAAGEMRERVEKLLGPAAEGLWVTTFHSACVRILRRDVGHLGLSRGFVIYDEDDSLGTVREALRRHGLDPKSYEPRRLRWRIDQWKNAGVLPAEAAAEAKGLDDELASELYATYQRLLAEANALDFGDLILQTVQLFDRFPQVAAHYRRRWQYVLVDEYQDTNRVQYRLVNQLAAEHRNLCVVGDPNQSIYAWRGADIRNILDFEHDYPDAAVVKLERNYRSTQPILEGSSALVAHNRERKEMWMVTEREGGERIRLYEATDDRDEAQFVVRQILAATRGEGRSLGDCAIFYRTNAQSRPFEEELLAHDVPYAVVGGVRFYERAEVKDALAYLRLLVNPADAMALRRIVNVPARGIGKTSIERAEELAASRGTTLLEALRLAAEEPGAGRAGAKVRAFLELMARLREDVLPLAPAEALARVLDRTGYLESLEKQGTPEAEGRLENLRELLSGAADFAAGNAGQPAQSGDARSLLELFLDQVALVSDLDAWTNARDRVSLMSVHMAKGLEFPFVFLVGLEEGLLPHQGSQRSPAALEEERRLCYVGMTRAMERLFLTCASERRRFGSRTFNAPSRFLAEIPETLTVGASFERTGSGAPREGERSFDYSFSQDEGAEGGAIRVGLRVRHPIFGPGTVSAVRGVGAGCKLDVRFDRVGVKTVLLRFANLEPL
ncbi:MAG TPA: UvrD-helicase domain-containing protein [Myxococcota bacterium]|nr:UvrD-helicase domain-containing protein [Myxococcota bacterium]